MGREEKSSMQHRTKFSWRGIKRNVEKSSKKNFLSKTWIKIDRLLSRCIYCKENLFVPDNKRKLSVH